MLRLAALLSLSLCALADKNIILDPPSPGAGNKSLLVFVPGGKVPNDLYVDVLKELQTKMAGKVDLWVSIVSCSLTGRLCLPVLSNLAVKSALKAGVKASGASAAETWIGGHSLGSVEADRYVTGDGRKSIAGGAMLWGGYVTAGVAAMVKYPVPVLQLVAELDYGSARSTKMAPYFAAAAASATLRTPVIVLPDIDHSDFCKGFNVSGDLPSATTPANAVGEIADAAAQFMLRTITGDVAAAAALSKRVDFTSTIMRPVNAALELETEAGWCVAVQKRIAGEYASNITVRGKGAASAGDWPAPTVSNGTVQVTGFNTYEGSWPPGASDVQARRAAPQGVPAVKRNTAVTLGCRMASKSAIAALFGANASEPENACQAANKAAWAWGMANAPQRVLDRYASAVPCNGCQRGVPVTYSPDKIIASVGDFEKAALGYSLGSTALNVQSSVESQSNEHSCKLLSPARVLDFLYFDAFTASRY
eukprot:TRINITY_DN1304_c4_g1_i2.p1 TRINITY_DN1304_c4_g1~~TRINITY_DN1304_c4_g1_i2.p1  ORF type:complete len:479 (+),score=100.64 TRINITY_DN1304_c4_g1_i2:64-1500(+)